MERNIFAVETEEYSKKERAEKNYQWSGVPDYSKSQRTVLDHIVAFLIGFVAGFGVMFVFYKIIPLSIVGGVIVGVVNIFVAQQKSITKRKAELRTQFYDMLEAMSVAMRAGNPVLKAMESACSDLEMIYAQDSDIIVEMRLIIKKFNNAIPMSVAFGDFAERSGLEDIASFASVYATIEGKSSKADEIVRETQQIIGDKMEIEMEIETLMTAAKSEANIMLVMPLLILLIIGYAGGGFMSAIYETIIGRIVATGGLIIFVISYILSKKFSNIEL